MSAHILLALAATAQTREQAVAAARAGRILCRGWILIARDTSALQNPRVGYVCPNRESSHFIGLSCLCFQ